MAKPQPMLRWAGGKRQLLDVLLAAFPKGFDPLKNVYFEPFLGGGAVFFALASYFTEIEIVALKLRRNAFKLSDTNEELMNFYTVVRNRPKELIDELTDMAKKCSEKDFYRVRETTPRDKVSRAARLLYLNRLCFNGLYRVNSTGIFNVPYGHLKNPVVCNSQLILECSAWFKSADLAVNSFSSIVDTAKAGDLVYFDPPYIPLSASASFASYVKEKFNETDQRQLAATINELTKKKVKVILSNSDTLLSREIFKNLNLFSITANRSISASGNSRGRVQELVGTNYSNQIMRDNSKLKSSEVN